MASLHEHHLLLRLLALGLLTALIGASCSTFTPEASPETVPERTYEPGCCGEGSLEFLAYGKSEFDPVVEAANEAGEAGWQQMRDAYDSLLVWAPYFDDNLAEFPNALVYRDVYAIYVAEGRDERDEEHPDWILRNASDQPVYIDWGCDEDGGCPQYAADIGNAEFRADFIERLQGLASTGYAGFLLDDVNLVWRFSNVDGDDATPIDPRTGEALTLPDWNRYMAEFMEEIREAFPDLTIMHNSIWFADTPGFDDEMVDRQIAAADIIMIERGANDDGLVAGDGKFGFRTFLEFSDRVHERGANLLFLDETAETPEEQWFNVVAALLVNDGDDIVTTEDYSLVEPDAVWPGFDIDLGDALAGRFESQGLLRRDFTDGFVLLNEPGRDTVELEFSTPMQVALGESVESLELPGGEAVAFEGSPADCVEFTVDGDDAAPYCPADE